MLRAIPFLLILIAAPNLFAQDTPKKMPRHVLMDTLMNVRAAMHGCYVEHVPAETRRGNGDNGRLKLRIWHDGSVHTAAFDDTTLVQPEARACVLKIAESLRFPTRTTESTLVLVWIGFDSKLENFVLRLESTPQTRLSSKDVVDAANARIDEFMACYTDRLDDEPHLEGRVKLQLMVDSAGKISSVKVLEDSLGDRIAVSCMKSIARTLKFEPIGDDAPVIARIPLTFRTR